MGIVACVIGCRTTPEVAPILDVGVVRPAQAAIVSVLPVGSDAAEVQIKDSPNLKSSYQLTVLTASGAALPLTPITEPVPANPFNLPVLLYPYRLTRYRVSGLTGSQTYRFRLNFRYNNTDTLTVERAYVHRPAANWTRLAHLPFDTGDFTGSPVALDEARSGDIVSLFRYVDENTMTPLVYYRSIDLWQNEPNPPPLPTPRPGMVQFVLYYQNSDRYRFWGLGYQTSDLFPGKYVYLRDLYLRTPPPYSQLNMILPSYLGEVGETAFFTTTDQAFFLTQNRSPAMFAITAVGGQRACQPLPEPPGTLATFSVDSVGYVVNQTDNEAPHLWAYDAHLDRWSRKADFPGQVRSRGVGFAVGSKGYFGLGISLQQEKGYRDIWEYDPANNQWQYVTDYPGQGQRYVMALSTPKRAFLGLGYETQPVVARDAVTRQVGCTDFWLFTP
ncbi:hypothetical protein HNV11_11325 [Spirosoma taeanense]|uniref:Galactose oxidase n=1 Tax=Spirosoma taeanense TaxID=2735870 RepID=A0A6M5Y968_9BACT|nr:hypothetical protein [Spirosoma taeanense]QJW89926.1 hypothetical protein HNV11_11325 [Spirosoma taeanense]